MAIGEEIERDGFTLLPGAFALDQVEWIREGLGSAIARSQGNPAVLGGEEGIYAARNVLTLWPEMVDVVRTPALREAIGEILGTKCGLVRVLYFDKPPGNTWALPWHKDLTIAVRENHLPCWAALHPTTKAGVPHVEAPEQVLRSMITARVHLDAVDDSNGPLKVVPGSHRDGKELNLEGSPICVIHGSVGDVLLIRPLVAHCSNRSAPDVTRHRRVLHLEFASAGELPLGLCWHDFREFAS